MFEEGYCTRCTGCTPETCPWPKPLSSTLERDGQIISQCKLVADRLTKHSTANICLQILCDTQDLNTATEIVNPLGGLSILSSFGIRLAIDYDKSIQALAQETLSRITSEPTPPTFHGYSLLPPELRMEILGFADLVSPLPTHFHHKQYSGKKITCVPFHFIQTEVLGLSQL